MTQIKETNIWAVKVPVGYWGGKVFNSEDAELYFAEYWETNYSKSNGELNLPEGEWNFLGEVSKDNISFNVEPYVQTTEWHFPERHIVYRNYLEPLLSPNPFMNDWKQKWGVSFATPTESFYSLLSASNLYWVNPMGEFEDFDKVVFNHSKKQLAQWQHYQNYLLPETTKLLILNKI